MIHTSGQKRVIITNVSPQVEEGKFPAKSAIHESFKISTDVFSDGHDEIAASAFVKKITDTEWTEYPLHFVINDHWETTYKATDTGVYEFKIEGWVDHYTTWKKGLKKKFDAGHDINVEIQIGVELLEEAASHNKANGVQLKSWASQLQSENPAQAVVLAFSTEISAAMYKHRHPNLITQYPTIYQFEVERKRAAFSTWYELFPRSASEQPGEHGTFKDVAKLLPRVSRMGFDVLYFPPIHPIGENNRKGRNNSLTAEADDPGSPWAIGNHLGGH